MAFYQTISKNIALIENFSCIYVNMYIYKLLSGE